MSNENVELVRAAYAAYLGGDIDSMLAFVDPDLEWTYRDPSIDDPEPQVCRGRHELKVALEHRAAHGLRSELEEIRGSGDRVMVVVRTPGVDAHRAKQANDRNFSVLTIGHGRIVAMRDCRDMDEAMRFAGLEPIG